MNWNAEVWRVPPFVGFTIGSNRKSENIDMTRAFALKYKD